MMSSSNLNSVDLRDNRYNQIIHLVSAANGAEDFYSTEDHSCRSEGVELARIMDDKAAAAWVGHPYFDVIDNSTDFETKICRMISSICQKLGIDVGDRLLTNSRKLKFLVRGPLPLDSEFPPFQDFDVVHNYLQSSTPQLQARLRKRGQKGHWSYIHTIRKPKHRGQVVEVRTQLNHRDYINLLAQRDDSHFTIFKKRRCFLINKQYFQLDIYREPGHPRCKGLMLLETYTALDSIENCLPPFLTDVIDVTGNPAYSMFNLSLKEEWDHTSKFCHGLKVSAVPPENKSSPPQDVCCNSLQKNGLMGAEVLGNLTNGVSKRGMQGLESCVALNGAHYITCNGVSRDFNGISNGETNGILIEESTITQPPIALSAVDGVSRPNIISGGCSGGSSPGSKSVPKTQMEKSSHITAAGS